MSNSLNVDIGGLLVGPSEPVRVMSVINLSPESFYKGAVADSIETFQAMIDTSSREGAEIIDIGGASTAPKNVYGTSDIAIEDEIKRVSQALSSIKSSEYPPMSILEVF